MKVSVIMLTYNREQFVGRMIDCVLAQDFDGFEFIIVDNGSTDSSGKIADGYAARDGRIRVIHRNGSNIGAGRNAGLNAAKGDYIAFVDDDDTCTSDYLAFLYGLAIENEADVAICGATWADIDEKKIMGAEEALLLLLWRKHYNVAFPTKMFRREIFDHLRFDEKSKYDDIYLMPKALAAAKRIAYHGLSKYHFERHETNNSAWTQHHELLDAATLEEYLKVYDDRTRWLCERFPDKCGEWNYFNWSFLISMVEKVRRLHLAGCGEICRKMEAQLSLYKDEFIHSAFIQDFERKWMEKYILSGG